MTMKWFREDGSEIMQGDADYPDIQVDLGDGQAHTLAFQPSHTDVRPQTQHKFTLNIFDNPKRSGLVLAVDHNDVHSELVRVDIWAQGKQPDLSLPMDGALKGWSFTLHDRRRKYRSRLVDGTIQLRGRAARVFCQEIAHELLRNRNVFVTLYLAHKDGARQVRFAINPDPEELVKESHTVSVSHAGEHVGFVVNESESYLLHKHKAGQ